MDLSPNLYFKIQITKMTNSKTPKGNIFVVTHTEPVSDLPPGYNYIKVGNKDFNLNYSDNIGVSIADLNPYFSELTAMYWIWKNYKCDSEDIVGLVHYRRFLTNGLMSILLKKPVAFDSIEKILSTKDIITPEKVRLKPNIYQNYSARHQKDDLDIALSIAESNDGVPPGTYFDFLNHEKNGFICNILMCKKKVFDNYSEWLFNILLNVFNNINFDDRNDYQKRVFGFLSERLFNVWLYKNKIDSYSLPMIRTDFSFTKNLNHLRLNRRRNS